MKWILGRVRWAIESRGMGFRTTDLFNSEYEAQCFARSLPPGNYKMDKFREGGWLIRFVNWLREV